MHIQTSLVFSLSAATALASTASVAPTGYANSTDSYAAEHKHIAELQSKVSSLKAEISSQKQSSSEACAVTGTANVEPSALPSGAVSRESSSGTAPTTYSAAYETYSSAYDNAQKSSISVASTTSRTAGELYPSGAVSNSTSVGPTGTGVTTSSAASSTSAIPTSYVPVLGDFSDSDIASGAAWKNVSSLADTYLKARGSNGSCTYENARVRTEFRSMSNADRKSFTDAIMCLQQTAPRNTAAGSETYPGVLNRYDEFVATHINMTYNIHGTADFLAWHRNFIFEFESDLNNVCGYTGNLPYWDWSADAFDLDSSAVFNGDEFSMGGNGQVISGRDDTYLGLQNLNFPPGSGGGCVLEGPFSNGTSFETHLGPLDSPYDNNVANQFDLNTRCLVRDLNTWFSSQFNTYKNVTDLVLGQTEVGNFQDLMQGFLGDNPLGVHGGGHWLGGGPSQLEDFHSSPADPVFFIHHAMVDRIWSVWVNLDAEERLDAISGTSTMLNSPPTDDMELSNVLSFGLVGEDHVFGDLMDTMAGPYCYRYE